VSLRLGAKPGETLAEGAEPLLMEILKGISLEVRLNLWKKLADVVLKLVESGELDASLLPILGGVAPAFLLRVSGALDITIDEYMKKKISENPLVEPVFLDAKTLIDSVSGKSFESEEEFQKWIEEDVPAPFNDIAPLLSKFLGDEVNVFVGSEFGGIRG